MPGLIRLLSTLAVLALLGWGAIWAAATFLVPEEREMVVPVSPDRLQPR